MINPFQLLKKEGELNETVRAAFIDTYKKRGELALVAVADGRVKKYLDFFVVVGNSDEYYIEEGVCSCAASRFGNDCWHTLAVRIAEEIHAYEEYNLWYYKNGVADEDDDEYEKGGKEYSGT